MKRDFGQTVEEQDPEAGVDAQPVAGVVLVFSIDRPMLGAIALGPVGVELGRGDLGGVDLDDARVSRRHVRVRRAEGSWIVTDLDSRNGTFVDGKQVQKEARLAGARVLRIGRSLFLLDEDIRRFRGAKIAVNEAMVVGPTLAQAHQEIARAARAGTTVLLQGESGAGKELAARTFHAAGPHPEGPFIAVNCAAIPPGLAERLLFGTRKGVYSGATNDATGHLQAAHGGTLFLDEIAELDREVQAKLLRALESREVLPLGASRPQPVDLRVCSATHKSLRAEAAAQRFREDLYYRIGRPEVRLPPLRDRLEEIPVLVCEELRRAAPGLVPQPTLIEEALLRPWPGNVRELRSEIRAAAQRALDAERTTAGAADLDENAGRSLAPPAPSMESDPSPEPEALPGREVILDALRAERGSVTRAARRLGVHRNRLRRWLARNPVDLDLAQDD